MKPNNPKRGRSRNGKRHMPGKNSVFDSNGPEVRVRGTAHQVLEKYLSLARDATSAGDRIAAESYYQYAEHYFRVINAQEANGNNGQPRMGRQTPADQPDEEYDGDDDDNGNGNGNENAQADDQGATVEAVGMAAQSLQEPTVGGDDHASAGATDGTGEGGDRPPRAPRRGRRGPRRSTSGEANTADRDVIPA